MNKDSEAGLHVAAVRGHYNTVRLLCQAGADLNTQDKVHNCCVGVVCMGTCYVCGWGGWGGEWCLCVRTLGGILSVITAGSPMVGTPINLVRGLIRQGLIKDLNLPVYVHVTRVCVCVCVCVCACVHVVGVACEPHPHVTCYHPHISVSSLARVTSAARLHLRRMVVYLFTWQQDGTTWTLCNTCAALGRSWTSQTNWRKLPFTMLAGTVASPWSKPCMLLDATSISRTRYGRTHTQTDRLTRNELWSLSDLVSDDGCSMP